MNKLIESLKKIKGASFASFTYQNSHGEIARHNVILGISYQTCLERSVKQLLALRRRNASKWDTTTSEACKALLASFAKSLTAIASGTQNEDYTKAENYVTIPGIRGLTMNLNDCQLHLFGLSRSKTVIVAGEYKEVNSKPLTLAKNALRRKLSIGKFREFTLSTDNFESANIAGKQLVFN
jgi:hypothetical protein